MVGVAINSHHLPNGRIGMKWSQPGNTAGPIFEQWILEDGCNKKEYNTLLSVGIQKECDEGKDFGMRWV